MTERRPSLVPQAGAVSALPSCRTPPKQRPLLHCERGAWSFRARCGPGRGQGAWLCSPVRRGPFTAQCPVFVATLVIMGCGCSPWEPATHPCQQIRLQKGPGESGDTCCPPGWMGHFRAAWAARRGLWLGFAQQQRLTGLESQVAGGRRRGMPWPPQGPRSCPRVLKKKSPDHVARTYRAGA